MYAWSRRAVLWSLPLLLLAACATEREERSYVQEHAIKKSSLDGDWYYLATVIDSPYEANWAFEGMQGELYKIKWRIEKDYLYAYRSHELVRGADYEVDRVGDENYLGEPVAAFRILSHFDIRRQYNPVNGEEYNIIEENTRDRLWYEREYMRVDWSENLIHNIEFLNFDYYVFPQGDLEIQPVSFYVQSEYDKYAPKFLDENHDGHMDYIDVVTAVTVTNGVMDGGYLDFGEILGTSQIITRHSFMRRRDTDYAPRFHPDDEFEHFAFFRTTEQGLGQYSGAGVTFDRQRGETDFLDYYMVRHVIWERYHSDLDCTKDVDCDPNAGSLCDPFVHKCTIPYAERVPKPVVYYTNALYPWDRYEAQTHQIENGWNRALQTVVNDLLFDGKLEVACIEDEISPTEGCCTREQRMAEADLAWNDPARTCVIDMFRIERNACNPEGVKAYLDAHPSLMGQVVEALSGFDGAVVDGQLQIGEHDLPEVCAAVETASRKARVDDPFEWQQLGDLRFNMVNYVRNPSTGSPLGYGPAAADPITGEIISATANVYGGAMDTYEGFILDLLDLSDGAVDENRYINGEYLREYFQGKGGKTGMPTVPQVWLPRDFGVDPEGLEQAVDDLRSRFEDFRALDKQRFFGSALERLAGTYIEDMELNDEYLLGFGLPPGVELTDDVKDLVSPLRKDFRALRIQDEAIQRKLSARNIMVANEYTDYAIINLINQARRDARDPDCQGADVTPDEYENLGEACATDDDCMGRNVCNDGMCGHTPEKARRIEVVRHEPKCRKALLEYVVSRVFRGVTEHELGHTLGLRHNFEGSFDSEGYNDRYWEIQRRHPLPDPEGNYSRDGLPYDRYAWDEESQSWVEGQDGYLNDDEYHLFWEDYVEAKHRQELEGRDKYMFASIMDYGGQFYSDFSGIGKYDYAAIKFGYGNLREIYDSQDLQYDDGTPKPSGIRKRLDTRYYLGGEVCTENSDCPYFDPDVYDPENYNPDSTRRNINLGNVTQTCGVRVLDPLENKKVWVTMDWLTPEQRARHPRGFCSNWDEDMAAAGVSFPRHRMCSDERRSDRPFCNTWDEGASATEIVENMIEMYNRMYPINNFRRYRRNFYEASYFSRIYGRYFQVIGKQHQAMFWRLFYQLGFEANDGPGGFKDMLTASIMGMNFFGNVLTTPAVGPYKRDPNTGVLKLCGRSDELGTCSYYPWNGTPSDYDSTLANGGKYQWSVYETGYYGAIERLAQFGTFLDKWFAIEALSTRSWSTAGGNDESIPLNYYDCYGDSILDLFSGIITERYEKFAPVAVFDEDLTHVQYIRPRDYWYGTFFGSKIGRERKSDYLSRPWPDHDPSLTPEEVQADERLTFLDPDLSIIHRIIALQYSLAYFSAFFDTLYADYVQLRRYDATWDPMEDQDPVNDVIEYRSPLRGRIYRAVQTYDGQSIAADLVQQAVDAKRRYEQAQTQEERDRARRELDRAESFLNIAADIIQYMGISF